MPPTEQEQRCAEAICRYLTEQANRVWGVQRWLDEDDEEKRSADVLLSDGFEGLMVEITRMTDGPEFSTHDNSLESLYRRLAPDSVRSYCLFLPPPHILRLEPKQVSSLKRSIESAAKGLRIGGKTSVVVHWQGTVKFLRDADVGYVTCSHVDDSAVVSASPLVSGVYILEDETDYCHQFLSEERRSEFHQVLASACNESKQGSPEPVRWEEEWELQRFEDSAEGEGGVMVIAVVAEFLESAAIQSVYKALRHGKGKFCGNNGLTKAAVALHAGERQHILSLQQYEVAIGGLSAADVRPLDLVFLVNGDRVHRCFTYD